MTSTVPGYEKIGAFYLDRELESRFDPELEELETVTVRPRKSDVEVRLVALALDSR